MSSSMAMIVGDQAREEEEAAAAADEEEEDQASRWGDLAPELLADVVDRVQQAQGEGRRVVAMAGVCRSWRRQILAFVRHKQQQQGCNLAGNPSQVIDFPWCLLQPGALGPDRLIRCLLKRKGNKFMLYQTLLGGKEAAADADASVHAEKHFLLAARRRWRPTGFSYIVGKDPADLMDRYGPGTLGKLNSNFWATEFVLWQTQDDAEAEEEEDSNKHGIPVLDLRFVEHIVNGIWQRRIQCALPHPCNAGGGLGFVLERRRLREERRLVPASVRSWLLTWSCAASGGGFKNCSSGGGGGNSRRRSRRRSSMLEIAATSNAASLVPLPPPASIAAQVAASLIPVDAVDQSDHLELRSKVPEWDPRQQCWSLDFNGRASLPSMHNFQLISAGNTAAPATSSSSSGNTIILQLGKIAKNVYTLDFGHPLSTFQAFAICLSSFATSAGLEP